jgi:oligopeptide/dipeptide ABC transporter ATP-binding protein
MSDTMQIDAVDDGAEPAETILDVRDLHVVFHTVRGRVQALRGVNLSLRRGETLAVLGESGSGKSVTAQVVLGILQSPPGHIERGAILFGKQDMTKLDDRAKSKIQGDRMSMVFQDALAALNPVFTVGWQIAELFKNHRQLSMKEGRIRAVELLRRVGIPNPERRVDDFPHQFSGGMRQRAMIAMALALEPDLVLADEPTTALDVTVQAQILQLLARMRRETGMALMLITHDIAVAAEIADRIAIMYAGRIVEVGSTRQILRGASHPYTQALIDLMAAEAGEGGKPIPGYPPDMISPPVGCAFHPRCPYARPICSSEDPQLRPIAGDQSAACHFAKEVRDHEAILSRL